MHKLVLLVALSICMLGRVSHGDVEVWTTRRVSSGTPAAPVQVTGATVSQRSGTNVFDVSFSYADVLLASPGLDPNPDGWIIWVFDRASAFGDPVNSIGAIDMELATSPLNNFIRVLIAPAPITGSTRSVQDFPSNWDERILYAGALDLESVSISPDIYESQVALALHVGGTVGRAGVTPRDRVQVGQIYRVEVPGRTINGATADGSIFADLIATSTNAFSKVLSGTTRGAIGRVQAARSIKGDIVAKGLYGVTPTDRAASIYKVHLFDASIADGEITGNILAINGSITEVLSVGRIGTNAAIRSRIESGEGIFQIRASAENSAELLERDFFADVKSNIPPDFTDSDLVRRPIHKLHTNGNFVGSIDTDFIRNDPGMAVGDNLGTEWGVVVGGTFTGDIRVRHSVLDASIAAKTFTSPTTEHPNQGHITIDHALEGSIVATASDGHIPFISVGRTPATANALPGFVGSKAEPQTFPFVPFTPASSPRFAPMPAQSEPDSVIAAASIGHATILRMIRGAEKLTPPRIECPEIGELIIDDMRQGVVWSGRLEYHALDSEGRPVPGTDGRPRLADPQDRTNDYSNIGTLTLGCVSPGADVWIEQTPSVKINEHLLGELFLPWSPLGQIIRIDRRLGTGNENSETDDRCPCDTAQVPSDLCNDLVPGWPANTTPPATDPSPRNIGVAATGAIRIADEIGLKGQIVINGSNLETTPAKAWSGAVVIGETATTPIVLATGSASPHTAPYYETSSAMLGGGSVGLVPFRIHEIDCEPPHRVRENPTNPELVVNTNFISVEAFASTADAPCKVRFYGPVMIDGGVDPTVIECASDEETEVCGRPWQPAAGLFTINGPSGGATGIASRTMSLSRRSTAPTVHVGKYRVGVRPVHATGVAPAGTAAEYWRICTGGLDEEESEAFFFRVAEGNAVDCQTCPADFDCSTVITVQDIFDFLGLWFGGC
ncbi:MAG: hypothetical protein ACK4WH_14045 [Phycisphaerales bacterium]